MHRTWQGINGISQISTGTHLPARCVPLGPHTAPLTLISHIYNSVSYSVSSLHVNQDKGVDAGPNIVL